MSFKENLNKTKTFSCKCNIFIEQKIKIISSSIYLEKMCFFCKTDLFFTV